MSLIKRKILKDPIHQRLFITALIVVGIDMVRSWLGYEQYLSSLLILILVAMAWLTADFLLIGKEGRKDRIKNVSQYLADNGGFVLIQGWLVAIIIFTSVTTKTPSDPTVEKIQMMVEVLGLLMLVIYPLIKGSCQFSVKT